MSLINIPQNGSTLTLTQDWQVEVDWRKRNLRMLAKFNLTGMKETGTRQYYEWDDQQDRYVWYERPRRETVPNKLFQDYDGNFTPVLLTFPAGTKFTVSRYNYSNYRGIDSVDLKCSASSMKGIKGLCLQLPLPSINGLAADISEDG